jgi:hypothetical protein
MKRLDASTSYSQKIRVEMPGAEFEKCSLSRHKHENV